MADAPAIPAMSEDDARRITERIRSLVVQTREGMEKVQRLLTEAKDGNAHVALGYSEGEWTKYMADLFADQPLRLPRDQRKELVGYLAGEGMSTRAIAGVVGASKNTVTEDRRQVSQFGTPAPSPAPDPTPAVDRTTGEVSDWPKVPPPGQAPTTHKTTGLDGKQYTRPETSAPAPKPRRNPLPDQARSAGWELRKAVERIERIVSDDRYAANKEEVALHLKSHLTHAVQSCQDVLDSINNA